MLFFSTLKCYNDYGETWCKQQNQLGECPVPAEKVVTLPSIFHSNQQRQDQYSSLMKNSKCIYTDKASTFQFSYFDLTAQKYKCCSTIPTEWDACKKSFTKCTGDATDGVSDDSRIQRIRIYLRSVSITYLH